MDEILARLDAIEGHLERLIRLYNGAPDSEWLTSTDFCRLVGLKDTKALTYQMSKGLFTPEAVRNIGTVHRPRYRFHRRKAVDQFLNRSAHLKVVP